MYTQLTTYSVAYSIFIGKPTGVDLTKLWTLPISLLHKFAAIHSLHYPLFLCFILGPCGTTYNLKHIVQFQNSIHCLYWDHTLTLHKLHFHILLENYHIVLLMEFLVTLSAPVVACALVVACNKRYGHNGCAYRCSHCYNYNICCQICTYEYRDLHIPLPYKFSDL